MNMTSNTFTIWDGWLINYIFFHSLLKLFGRMQLLGNDQEFLILPNSALRYNHKILNRDAQRLKERLELLHCDRITFTRYLHICCTCWQRYYNTHGWSKIFWKSAPKCIFIVGIGLLNRLVSSSIVY